MVPVMHTGEGAGRERMRNKRRGYTMIVKLYRGFDCGA